jgi:hypothetical protein
MATIEPDYVEVGTVVQHSVQAGSFFSCDGLHTISEFGHGKRPHGPQPSSQHLCRETWPFICFLTAICRVGDLGVHIVAGLKVVKDFVQGSSDRCDKESPRVTL